jgi:hypothetical protein
VAVEVARAVPEYLRFRSVKDMLSGIIPGAVNAAVVGIIKAMPATPGAGIVPSVSGKWWSSWGSIVKAILASSVAEMRRSVMNATVAIIMKYIVLAPVSGTVAGVANAAIVEAL